MAGATAAKKICDVVFSFGEEKKESQKMIEKQPEKTEDRRRDP
jgi:hypothetical protein